MSVHSSGYCATKIENLSVRFNEEPILDNVNLNLRCGELTAIIGPNGAGKSTLFKALLDLISFNGKIEFMSMDGRVSPRPRTGYVPQQLDIDRLAPISVEDMFAACFSKRPAFLPPSPKTKRRIETCLKEAGISELANRKVGALSGGELQRALLALATNPMPELLLLDEPVSGVDISGMQSFYESVIELKEKKDLTILLISHDFDAVNRFADRVALLNATILADGPPETTLRSDAFKAQFGFRWGADD